MTTIVESSFPNQQHFYFDSSLFQSITHDLATQGYSVVDEALPESSLESLLALANQLSAQDFKPAGVGRQENYRLNAATRSDRIHWLSGPDEYTEHYFQWIEGLRLAVNRELFLGLFDYECHFALYPPGGFYRKHVDAFRGESNRRLTTILYLNTNWQTGDGGELALYQCDDPEPFLIIQPEFGRMVIFLSEEFPHEVLEARKPRYSLSGWYRVNGSTSECSDPPVFSGQSPSDAKILACQACS